MRSDKISRSLAVSLEGSGPEDWLDLIVEVGTPAPQEVSGSCRAEKIASLKDAFARRAGPVMDRIRCLGGEVTEQAWINGSLRARMLKRTIPDLSEESSVARLDLPHKILAEAK